MHENQLFSVALGLSTPWIISSVEFKDSAAEANSKELHITIDHEAGSKFEVDGKVGRVYDHQNRSWRHLNFFQHVCYLHCKVPRIKTEEGQVVLVQVPWAQPGSSFTLLFQAYSMLLVKSGMSLSSAGKYLNCDSRVIGRIIKQCVNTQLSIEPLEQVAHMGIDETSTRKGHHYLTVLTDVDRKKVVGLSPGKGKEAVESALIEVELRGSDRGLVSVVSLDLSPAFISAAKENFPLADLVYDRYHITALLNKAVDEVRRQDQRDNAELKRSRYLWLRNKFNLNTKDTLRVDYLAQTYPRIGKAYQLKEQFREIWDKSNEKDALSLLTEWTNMAWESGLEPLQKFVNTIDRHWEGIETYFKWKVSNGFVERVNLKIQEIKRLAKGYRNIPNFMTMIYFHLGGLDLGIPT